MKLTLPKLKPTPVVNPKLDERGGVDWDSTGGAAVSMRPADASHPLAGQSVQVKKKGDHLVILSPDGMELPIPMQGAPSNETKAILGLPERAQALSQALDTLYGLQPELDLTPYELQAEQFATQLGFVPEQAELFGRFVATPMAEAYGRRVEEVRHLLREGAALFMAERQNEVHKDRKASRKQDEQNETKAPLYGHGRGVHMQDAPLTKEGILQALDVPEQQDIVQQLQEPLHFTVDADEALALLHLPPVEVQHRLAQLLGAQAQEQHDMRHLSPVDVQDDPDEHDVMPAPSDDARALQLVLPPVGGQVPNNPGKAEAALKTHAGMDGVNRAQMNLHAPPPHMPVQGSDEKDSKLALILEALDDPAFAWTAQYERAQAGSPIWHDASKAEDFPPVAGLGYSASDAISTALAGALSFDADAQDIVVLCQYFPAEPLALLLGGLFFRHQGLETAPQSLLDVAASINSTATQRLPPGAPQDPVEQASDIMGRLKTYGAEIARIHIVDALRWVAESLPAFVYRYGDDLGEMPVEIRFGDSAAAARELVETITRAVGSDKGMTVQDDGHGTTLRLPLAQMAAFAHMRHEAAEHEAMLTAYKYNMQGAIPNDAGQLIVEDYAPEGGIAQTWSHGPGLNPSTHQYTLAERNAIEWLREAKGGLVTITPDRDWQVVVAGDIAGVLADEPDARSLIVVPAGLVQSTLNKLGEILAIPDRCLGLNLDIAPKLIEHAVVAVTDLSTATQRKDVVNAYHPESVYLYQPQGVSWENGGGFTPQALSLLGLPSQRRVAFVEHSILSEPLRLWDLCSWVERGKLENMRGPHGRVRYADSLPPRGEALGVELGIGVGSGAHEHFNRHRLAPLLAPFVVDGPLPHSRAVEHAEAPVNGVSDESSVVQGIKEAGKTSKEAINGKLIDRESAKQQLDATARPLVEQVIWSELSQRVAEAASERIASDKNRAVVMGDSAQLTRLQSFLETKGLSSEGEEPAVVSMDKDEDALMKFRNGTSDVLLVSPDTIAGVDLGLAQTFHVLSQPKAAVKLLRHETSSLSMGPLQVLAYRDRSKPFDTAAWRSLEMACQTVGHSPLQKAMNDNVAVWPHLFEKGDKHPVMHVPSKERPGSLPGTPHVSWHKNHKGKRRQLALHHKEGVLHAVVGYTGEPHHHSAQPCSNYHGALANYASCVAPQAPSTVDVNAIAGVSPS